MTPLTFSKEVLDKLHEELQVAVIKNNVSLYRVIQALIWLGEGKPVSMIAELLNVTNKTVYNWLKRFMCKRFDWLLKRRYVGRGRKSKLTKAQKSELYKMIVAGPESCGFDCGVWNSALIAELVMLRFNVKYNPRYLSSLLKKMGLSYQKARFISDKCDEEEYKKARKKWCDVTWPQILKDAKKTKAVILFGDEVSFAMWGSLARTWAPIGKQPIVKTTGIRKGLKMYGAIEFNGGGFQYMESLVYSITAKSIKALKADGMTFDVLESLKPLKNQKYKTLVAFTTVLEDVLGSDVFNQYRALILKYTQTAGRFEGEGYIEFLKQLLQHLSVKIILIEDGASYHNSKVVKKFVEKHACRLTLERLPAFSPDYNPIEKLWRNTKSDATHLKYFKTFEELRASVVKTFQKYLFDATHVIRVMKKLRFEAGIPE
jgi:transposase